MYASTFLCLPGSFSTRCSFPVPVSRRSSGPLSHVTASVRRCQGRRLFETGSLADRNLGTREFVQVFLALMQLGWQHMTRRGADTTVIAVNPRHSTFHTRLHGFLPLGPRRAYDKVQGHPAEAFYLDPHLMAAHVPEMYQRMFGRELPAEALAAPRMPEHLIYYFAARSSQTQLATVQQILWTVKASGSPRRCQFEGPDSGET